MKAALVVVGLALVGCTALGASPNLTLDCEAQATLLASNIGLVPKLLSAERASIDAQRALSNGYCSGNLPADQSLASKAVETATAHITAILAVAQLRK